MKAHSYVNITVLENNRGVLGVSPWALLVFPEAYKGLRVCWVRVMSLKKGVREEVIHVLPLCKVFARKTELKVKPSLSCIERSVDTQCFNDCSLCWVSALRVQGWEGSELVEFGTGDSEGLCGASSQGIKGLPQEHMELNLAHMVC